MELVSGMWMQTLLDSPMPSFSQMRTRRRSFGRTPKSYGEIRYPSVNHIWDARPYCRASHGCSGVTRDPVGSDKLKFQISYYLDHRIQLVRPSDQQLGWQAGASAGESTHCVC